MKALFQRFLMLLKSLLYLLHTAVCHKMKGIEVDKAQENETDDSIHQRKD